MGIYIGTNEIKDIFVGEGIDDYSAMQGPAPDGFHVPSKDEWVALCGILTTTFGMGAGDATGTYLKMPMAGYRSQSSASVSNQGSIAIYRSSTRDNSDTAYSINFDSTTLNPQRAFIRAFASSVRCFKDSPVIPTFSWTTLYDGSSIATGAGVFWNSSDGLISVSGDGVNWYTIQDKNLGATTVFNRGDTLTEANCGGYFQWGNNYMFPFTGTVTTSSTQVDASNYGPGNYYESSTFIIGNRDWSSVHNNNLRGGDTGITKKGNVIEVYLGTTKIRPNMPAEFTDWDSGVVSAVSAELQGNIDDAILNLFGETFYTALDDDIGNGDSLEELGWVYDTITSGNDEWYGLQISDGGDMTDMNHIIPYNDSATDAVCIVRDNDDRTDIEYLVGTSSGHGSFAFQLSSLASNFSGKDTVCMFIFLV